MAFFDVSLSEIVETGADAFVATKEAETAKALEVAATEKTKEADILAQAKAAGNQAMIYAKENQKTIFIVIGVLALGYVAVKSK